jgi:ankyrin repeat protein
VERLLEAGADTHITSGNKHWTPIQAANFRGHEDIVEVLKKAGALDGMK